MAYAQLEETFRRIGLLRQIGGVLGWDMQAMMPSGGGAIRSEQLALLQVLQHEVISDPRVSDLLDTAEAENSLGVWERANLAEMRRQWVHATAVEPELVRALSEAGSECFMVWRGARPDNDFDRLRPHLERVFDLVRQTAAAKAEALGTTPYDAMLDMFEPGARAADISRVFATLAESLPGILAEVEARQEAEGAMLPLEGPFQVDVQRELARRLMASVGFDFEHGRLDESAHPFCGGVPDDVRITTRYHEEGFLGAMMAVLHETGHAMYERQLPVDWRSQPVGGARGMATHESQSLLIEMQASRSAEFVGWFAPVVRDAFSGTGPAWETGNVLRHYRRVERGLIRVDADEVSYPLHVILRFDLERALFAGELEIADLPGAWNDAMERYVGVRPDDDRDGCMQDIHWMDGAFGYFPSYTLGAIAAAQFFGAACDAHPEVNEELGRGEFGTLMGWLRENIHQHGALHSTEELLVRATGRGFDPVGYLDHLRRRYLS